MTLHFYLRFSTKFGQTLYVSGNTRALGNDDLSEAFPIEYLNESLWHGSITIDAVKDINNIRYKYILREPGKEETVEFGDDRIIAIDAITADEVVLVQTSAAEITPL